MNKIKFKLLGFIIFTLLIYANLVAANEKVNSKDKDTAVCVVSKEDITSANQGKAQAQYKLGKFYDIGGLCDGSDLKNVSDLKKAAYWYEKAANQGNADAQYKLALMLASGVRLSEDLPKKALNWLEKAATQGHSESQQLLGFALVHGVGVPKDVNRGVALIEKSANQGNVDAQTYLGEMYLKGELISKDYKKSAFWFNKAAIKNDASAQFQLGRFYYLGQGVVQDYKKAAFWVEKSANQDYPEAQNGLGVMFELAQGMPQSDDDAFNWYSKAAKNYNTDGYYNVGRMLTQNQAFAAKYASNFKDSSKTARERATIYNAYVNFNKAAEGGHVKAQYELALLFNYGKGTPKDYKAAAYWFEKAAHQGVVDAQMRLGQLYLLGHGVPKDIKKAIYWYGKDVRLKDPNIDKQIEVFFNFCEDINVAMLADNGFLALRGTQLSFEKKLSGADETKYNSKVGIGKYTASSCYITDDGGLPPLTCRKSGVSYQAVKTEASKLENEVSACLALYEIKSSSKSLVEEDNQFSNEASAQIIFDSILYSGYIVVSGECSKSSSSGESQCFNEIKFTLIH